jgi:hypothetical protein
VAQGQNGGLPIALICFITGLVLRFGIDGYNTLGDILIGVGLALFILGLIFAAIALAVMAKVSKNVGAFPTTTRKRARR